MVRGGQLLVCAVTLSMCLGAAHAAVDDVAATPYGSIVARNVFGLNPPPPPPEPPKPPSTPPPKITLTGITTILGKKKALMMTQSPKQKEPEYYTLSVGERQGEIEVLAIDAEKRIVVVKNHGQEETLDFENNGARSAPAQPLPDAPRPGVQPAAAASGGRPTPTIPTRTLRLPPAPGNQ